MKLTWVDWAGYLLIAVLLAVVVRSGYFHLSGERASVLVGVAVSRRAYRWLLGYSG